MLRFALIMRDRQTLCLPQVSAKIEKRVEINL